MSNVKAQPEVQLLDLEQVELTADDSAATGSNEDPSGLTLRLEPSRGEVDLPPPWSDALRRTNRLVSVLFAVLSVLLGVDAGTSGSGRVAVVLQSWLWRRGEGGGAGVESHVTVVGAQVHVGVLSCVFTFLAALDHFLVGWPLRHVYERSLRDGCNPFRWCEYAVSASVMNVMIAVLCGVLDVLALLMLACLTATCMMFGLLGEMVPVLDVRVRWLVFCVGCVPYACVWTVIWVSFVQSVRLSGNGMPSFVWAIVCVLFVVESAFAYNQVRRVGSYLERELAFILLSPTAKLLLAGLTYGGMRAL